MWGVQMKRTYQELEIELLFFVEDIVTLSENGKDDVTVDIFAPQG